MPPYVEDVDVDVAAAVVVVVVGGGAQFQLAAMWKFPFARTSEMSSGPIVMLALPDVPLVMKEPLVATHDRPSLDCKTKDDDPILSPEVCPGHLPACGARKVSVHSSAFEPFSLPVKLIWPPLAVVVWQSFGGACSVPLKAPVTFTVMPADVVAPAGPAAAARATPPAAKARAVPATRHRVFDLPVPTHPPSPWATIAKG
jgi:hypothetical protein